MTPSFAQWNFGYVFCASEEMAETGFGGYAFGRIWCSALAY